MRDGELLDYLRERELMLQEAGTRADRAALARLLHPRFREFGRSGRTYTREAVLSELPAASAPVSYHAEAFEVKAVSADAALLTYRSGVLGMDGRIGQQALRSSLWVHGDDGWQLLFHQGTPAAT
ncbi:MAG: nuclear transport factor 2 family protein [Pseudomonadales bacterium]|nr:nuclear transport factor 2 family protein [Pseudomonadales bacterium]